MRQHLHNSTLNKRTPRPDFAQISKHRIRLIALRLITLYRPLVWFLNYCIETVRSIHETPDQKVRRFLLKKSLAFYIIISLLLLCCSEVIVLKKNNVTNYSANYLG